MSFVNPYNFVPFGEDLSTTNTQTKETVYRGAKQSDLLSGWLDVRLLTKSPIVIPDAAHPKYFDTQSGRIVTEKPEPRKCHLMYSFLKLFDSDSGEKKFAIPGSTLRGMIRSNYETVTNSCLPFLPDDKPMSQRVPLYSALNKRGLLCHVKNQWILYKTQKTLEEVVVIPCYELNGKYYVKGDPIASIRNEQSNQERDKNKKYKYAIMGQLNAILQALRQGSICVGHVPVIYGADFRYDRERRSWDVTVDGRCVGSVSNKTYAKYLFIRANGSVIKEEPGTFVAGRGWIQYNVPVDLRKIYHVAYLQTTDDKAIAFQWPHEITDVRENKHGKAYTELMSAIKRDGAETYKKGGRANEQVNRDCNFALERALNEAEGDSTKMVPVYYFVVGTSKTDRMAYLSGAASGRIAQRRKWMEIMEGHVPCDMKIGPSGLKGRLCPACLLFGTVNGGGMKGHIRVTDAFVKESEKLKPINHILQVLAAPRPSSFEFYLNQPEGASYWNFDFFSKPITSNGKSFTAYYQLERAMPRGRKMYWHHEPLPDAPKRSNLNSSAESIDKAEFGFKVYFEQITKQQLKDLIWVITLGENKEDSRLCQKIGHAKPLGYGSVKLLIDGGMIRTVTTDESGAIRYKMTDMKENTSVVDVENVNTSFDLDSEILRSFLTMCNLDAVKTCNLDYPRREQDGKIFEWFSDNRRNPKTLRVLPKPTDPDKTLPREKR